MEPQCDVSVEAEAEVVVEDVEGELWERKPVQQKKVFIPDEISPKHQKS